VAAVGQKEQVSATGWREFAGIEGMAMDGLEERFSSATIREKFRRAGEQGAIIEDGDGNWSLPPPPETRYLQVKITKDLGCGFSLRFLFRHVYEKATVPYACRACYKVKIVPRSLRELIALRGILESLDYHSKCGVDFYNPHSQDWYAGFLYLDGLDEARAAYRVMRHLVDADPKLGPAVGMTIKRGCTEYEVTCGPADKYEFPEEMAAMEADLRARFKLSVVTPTDYRIRRAKSMVGWIEFAYSIKDDTYLDFTGGKRLYPATVAFSPEDPSGRPEIS